MRQNVRQGLKVLRGVLEYLEKEVTVPADVGPLNTHINALKAVADRISTMMEEQDARMRAFRGASEAAQQITRKLLKAYVRPVSRMGKLLFPTDATLRAELTVPKAPVNYQAAITAALAIATRVEAHKAKFVEAGFAEDFIDKMRSTAAALETALKEKAEHVSRRATATSGLVMEFGRSREMVRMLDDMVVPLLEGTPKLAGWKTVSRFARRGKREEAVPVDGSVGSSPTPVPQAPVVPTDNASPATHAV